MRGGNLLRRLVAAGLAGLILADPALGQGLADPAGSGVIVSAVRWLEGTLLGTVATVVAVIAVATVGLLMLTGRINWRYAFNAHAPVLPGLAKTEGFVL